MGSVFVIIPFDALDVDARGRLRRDRAADITAIRALLERRRFLVGLRPPGP
jgi:hypothetical protein